ncbi:hypothetical protein EV702DRAFT_1133416 [Suillus placidus]|uniref:Uncharacterized protein n=1 Tax=Suillus placidus TaxID=48579 RepID=A0A9P7CZX3_9AGAM|nr:hypothetical protein EV702DRAFT_1133416 [Suillus placidus]
MFRSLLRFPTKPHGHEDAEKELVKVMDLFSKYPSHLVETDKTEFKNEYERLQREIRLYKAGESTAKLRNVDIMLDDCRALKCKVKKTIDDRRVASVRGEVSAPTGVGGLGGHQKLNPPARDALETKSSHSNQPPNVKTIPSFPTTSASTLVTDKTRFKPQSEGVPSVKPRSGLPQSQHIPVSANLKQAISQVTSGTSCEVDSMVMMGTNAKCPTMNIDSPDCAGAKILSHGPQVAQQVPQPARPRRAVGRRPRQQPRNFMKGNYSSNSSMILCGSSVMGATLNINARNSSGAVFHHDNHLKRVQ